MIVNEPLLLKAHALKKLNVMKTDLTFVNRYHKQPNYYTIIMKFEEVSAYCLSLEDNREDTPFGPEALVHI